MRNHIITNVICVIIVLMDYKIVEVKENLLIENNQKAQELREHLSSKGVYFINVMASPGSGKTTLLVNLINRLKNDYSIGVMEADIDGDVDADRIHKLTGVPSIQVHTSGACHLTAQMVEDAINSFDIKGINLLILENVGNLVCPAEFVVGEDERAVILSITEGDDKPMKYPLIFKESAVAVLNKIDLLPYTNFNLEGAREDISTLHPGIDIIKASCTKNQGIAEWCGWLKSRVAKKK